MCNEKWIVKSTCDNLLSGWIEKKLQSTSQTKLAPKKGHGHCLVVCCPSDPLQFSESQWNHYIWEVCSANRWEAPKTATPAAGIGQQKGPNSPPGQYMAVCPTTIASKVERVGLWSFASSAIFTWLLANQLPLFKHLHNFLQGKRFHNQQETENAFQEYVKSLSMGFYATGINKLISHWQKCIDYNGSYFD